MIRVELFTKDDCSLCVDAKAVLEAARAEVPFELVEIDITEHPEHYERYKWDIPVIHVNGHKAFKHRVDLATLKARLHRAETQYD